MTTGAQLSPDPVERLISTAERLADAPLPEPPQRRRGRAAATIVGALVVVGGAATWLLAGGDKPASSTSAIAAPAATSPDPAITTVPITTVPGATVPVTTAPAASEPVATSTEDAVTQEVTTDNAPIRYAEFSGGKVYLRGTVPDQATADKVAAKAAAVVGATNVVVEYAIVPGTPVPNDAPLYVRDSILFAPGSSQLNSSATAVLDLGVMLFQQNPQMTMIIEGHTDSDGTAEENLRLAQSRVDEILRYFAGKGVDPSRVTGVAKGESEPQASNDTSDGRARNRRVEAQIINLLG